MLPNARTKIAQLLWMLVRGSPVLNVPVAGGTIRTHLMKLSSTFLQRAVPNPMLVDGHRVYHHVDSWEIWPISIGSFEPETSSFIRRLLLDGQTFIDLGAHIGYFTLLAARAVGPTGHVYAFEPAPASVALLIKNIEVNGYAGNVTIVPKAVSNSSGVSQIFLNTQNSMWHTTCSHWGGQSVRVEMTSLDEFFAQEGWPPIHLIKMDIEGAEKAAIDGMRELSDRNPGLKLIVEFAAGSFVQSGIPPEELFQAIRDLGFARLSIISKELLPVTTLTEMLDRIRNPTDPHNWSTNLLCEK